MRSVWYSAHRATAERFYRDLDIQVELTLVTDRTDLRPLGQQGFYFFDVVGHPQPIPARIKDIAEALGCTWVKIDDWPARQRYERSRRS